MLCECATVLTDGDGGGDELVGGRVEGRKEGRRYSE